MTIDRVWVWALVVGIFCCMDANAFRSPRVRTPEGVITGTVSGDGLIASFKGIPYAAPPVGDLRWRAPDPVAPWKGLLRADHFGASCMQGPNKEFGPWTKEFLYVTPPSENCLFLNVWTPKTSAAANLPVLVFIHGGGFTSGSGDVPVYDGEALARTGMVVVTINYRVGVFGFFAYPELTAESKHGSSGDYGLLDQIAALRWVQTNIAAFGGNPAHVAVAGQSAGAMSVADLLASPLAKGLFSAAIADSGIGLRGVPFVTLAAAEKAGLAFASRVKANSVAALRGLPAQELMRAQQGMLGPVVDGWVLPEEPVKLTTERGVGSDVPVITGFQQGDSQMGPRAATVEAYRAQARQTYGPLADEFLILYAAATDADVEFAEAASGHDRVRTGAYLWAAARTETHRSPVFVYYFDRAIPWPAHPEFGAFHTGEIPYAFGTLGKLDRPWEPEDHRVTNMMMNYWKQMAETGNPNGGATPKWTMVDASTPEIMRLGSRPGEIAPAEPARLAFWKRYFNSSQSEHRSPF